MIMSYTIILAMELLNWIPYGTMLLKVFGKFMDMTLNFLMLTMMDF